jgi:3-hydroxyisobutyrate dehydrogenase
MTEQKMRVIFLGLGRLGGPLAANLAAAGHEVAGYDPDDQARARLHDASVAVHADIAALPREVDVILTCLRGPDEISTAFDDYERAHGHLSAPTAIDFSTISPADSAELARRLKRSGTTLLRVAVSGSAQAAEAKQVAFICSGPAEVYSDHTHLLDAIGRSHSWVGAEDESRAVKLAMNLIVGAGLAALIEAVTLAEGLGIERKLFLDVVSNSAVASPFYAAKTDALVNRDYTPAATTTLMKKDLNLALKAAEQLGRTLPLADASHDLYARCIELGWAEQDFACLYELYEQSA